MTRFIARMSTLPWCHTWLLARLSIRQAFTLEHSIKSSETDTDNFAWLTFLAAGNEDEQEDTHISLDISARKLAPDLDIHSEESIPHLSEFRQITTRPTMDNLFMWTLVS